MLTITHKYAIFLNNDSGRQAKKDIVYACGTYRIRHC